MDLMGSVTRTSPRPLRDLSSSPQGVAFPPLRRFIGGGKRRGGDLAERSQPVGYSQAMAKRRPHRFDKSVNQGRSRCIYCCLLRAAVFPLRYWVAGEWVPVDRSPGCLREVVFTAPGPADECVIVGGSHDGMSESKWLEAAAQQRRARR